MYTEKEITLKYKKLAQELGEVFNVPVAINGRLTKTLGRVKYSIRNDKIFPYIIEISKQLLENATRESIDEVLIHEFCHWYLAETTHENHGHDKVFKELCQRLGGGSGKTHADHIEYLTEASARYKYQCFCEKCGKEVAHYSRMCPTVKNPKLYTTYCCEAAIKVVQNW